MSRGAPLTVLDDQTPLNGPDLDVAARIGWVVRMARIAPTPDSPGRVTLDELARRIGTNSARLYRLEVGRLRDGALVDACELALGRPVGSLRAPIDIICRTFPSSPVDRDPSSAVRTTRELSRLTEHVEAPGPSGGDWLTWARALSQPGAIGMPERIALPLVHTLIGELNRSVGHGYPSRYEALALLRCSDYGHLVLEAAQERVRDPHVQVLLDMMSAVSEAITPDAVDWCLELLAGTTSKPVAGAALALENMGEISAGEGFWRGVAPSLVEIFNSSEPGSSRWEWLSHLIRLMPRSRVSRGPVRLDQPLAPAAAIKDWSTSRRNAHWTGCQERAHEITGSLGLSDQPMLARLLFDIAVSPHETRAATSSMLLTAVPHLGRPVAGHLVELVDGDPDEVIRGRAARHLPGTLQGAFPEEVARWLTDGSSDQRDTALYVAGGAAAPVAGDVLEAGLGAGEASARAALYAAGMMQHPILGELASDVGAPEWVRGAAGWWRRQGGRVYDAPTV